MATDVVVVVMMDVDVILVNYVECGGSNGDG